MLGVKGYDNALCQKNERSPLLFFQPGAIAHHAQDRSPFLVSDDRSPKMKERSPLTPHTQHSDDCTQSDRPSRIKTDRPFLFLMSKSLK